MQNPPPLFFEKRGRGICKFESYNRVEKESETLINQQMSGCRCTVKWDVSGMSSGLYFARLESAVQAQVQKLVLTK